MPFTAKLLLLPPWLLFILINIIFIGISVFLLHVIRGVVQYQLCKGHNDVVASIFNKAGTVFGIVLAFVVVILWQDYNKSMDRALKEGIEALELYQDLNAYPDKGQISRASKSLLNFADLVVKDEYPAMAKMKISPATEQAMTQMRNEILHINPKTLQEQILYNKILRTFENLSRLRQERLADMESSLPGIVWGALIVGAFITIMFSICLGAEKLWLHSLLLSMLAIILATVFYLIIELDYPFVGKLSAKPTSYLNMLQTVGIK
jgi:hypothetical protein